MPVHDWTRVPAGTFHHLHQGWITELSNSLNNGVLPEGYYAMAEQVAGRPHPDVLALEEHEDPWSPPAADSSNGRALAVAEHPPQVRYTLEAEASRYAAKADRIAICHSSGDRVVAFVEIVSPGNKHSHAALTHFLDKLTAALDHGCHLLIIDLHPPGTFDPEGLPVAFWDKSAPATPEQPLSLAAYRAGDISTAYVEPVAVGDTLPDMPLFLTPEYYVNAPLEASYQAAWRGVPGRWKRVIEGPAASPGGEMMSK